MKIGVLLCDGNHKWMEDFDKICDAAFKLHDDVSIQIFDCYNNEIPILENINEFDAFACMGSKHSVNEELPWMLELEKFFLCFENSNTKLVGLCFGHQLICKAYGGRIRKVKNGFVFGADDITFDIDKIPETVKDAFLEHLHKDTYNMTLLKSHGDEVSELGPGMISVASSSRCQHECILIRKNILAFQCHPDLNKDLMMDILWPSFVKEGTLDRNEAENVKTEMANLDTQDCRKLIHTFIKTDFY